MLKMRIIPCLDVKDNKVVKGVRFKNHQIVGDILDLAKKYCEAGADELVFYDITASSDDDRNHVKLAWVEKVAECINIPFCVAGGIRTVADAEMILASGADKVSINSPAIENPDLIDQLAYRFGSQCVVVGIDSFRENNNYFVHQYTGSSVKVRNTYKKTIDWINEVASRGAGEVVINSMNQDGVKSGYDIEQILLATSKINIPIIASGGAGKKEHFLNLFNKTRATGALAASVFHNDIINIRKLKLFLDKNNIEVRL